MSNIAKQNPMLRKAQYYWAQYGAKVTGCVLTAASVELIYWPTPYTSSLPNKTITSAPSLTTLVGPDGHTYTSPSVYVVYSALAARALGGPGQFYTGSTYSVLTMAYDATELSTLHGCTNSALTSAALDFRDFNLPPRWSVLSRHQYCDWCGQVYQFPGPPKPGDEIAFNYANMTLRYNIMARRTENFRSYPDFESWNLQPTLVLPPSLNDMQPAWKDCKGFEWGTFDPPRALDPKAAMITSTKPPVGTTAENFAEPPIHSDKLAAQTPAPSHNQQDPSTPKLALAEHSTGDSPTHSAQTSSPDPTLSQSQTSPPKHLQNPSREKLLFPASRTVDEPDWERWEESWADAENTPSLGSKVTPGPLYPDILAIQTPAAGYSVLLEPGRNVVSGGKPNESGTAKDGVQVSHNSAERVIESDMTRILPAATTGMVSSPMGKGFGNNVIADGSSSASGAKVSVEDNQIAANDEGISSPPATIPYAPVNAASVQPFGLPDIEGLPAEAEGQRSAEHVLDHTSIQAPSYLTLGIVAAKQTWTPLNEGRLVANGATLSIGGPALTVSGTVISMKSAGLIADGSTIVVPGLLPSQDKGISEPTVFTAAGQTVTPLGNNQFQVNGATLRPGGPASTVEGVRMSLGSSEVIIGTSTIPLPSPVALSPLASQPMPVPAAGHTFTPIGDGRVLIDGATITQGESPDFVQGASVSLGSSVLVIGSSTVAMPTPIETSPPTTLITAAGHTFTPIKDNRMLVDGQTLTQGAPATIFQGVSISLGFSVLVIGSSIVPISDPAQTSAQPTPFTADGMTFTPAGAHKVALNGVTLKVGGTPVTSNGTIISLGSEGLVVDGSTTITTSEPPTTTSARISGGSPDIGTESSALITGKGDLEGGTSRSMDSGPQVKMVIGLGLVMAITI